MVTLHTLRPAKGAVRTNKRYGRGTSSGMGGTSTRGHKGAKSRSGYSQKLGFEGGQMPLQRRVPKYGFNNPFKIVYKVINLDDLQKLAETFSAKELDFDFFQNHGLVSKRDKLKVLGRGELKASLNIKAHAFSQTAKEAIEKVGGTIDAI